MGLQAADLQRSVRGRFRGPALPLTDAGFSSPRALYLSSLGKNLSPLFVCAAETIVNVLDFKKDVGLWHGILTVGVARAPPYRPLESAPGGQPGSSDPAAGSPPRLQGPVVVVGSLELSGEETSGSTVSPWGSEAAC